MQCQSSIHSQASLIFGNGFRFCLKLLIWCSGENQNHSVIFPQNKAKQVMLSGKIDL